jgi:CheY-like chemotaxis protein
MPSISDIVAALGAREEDFSRMAQFGGTDLVAGASVLRCASIDEVLLAQERHGLRALCVCSAEPAARLNEVARWLAQRGERVPTLLAYPGARSGDVPWPALQPVLMPLRPAPAAPAAPQAIATEDRVSLDHLISGIAHDFNNLLAIIMGEVQLAMTRKDAPRQDHHLRRAEEGCYRLAGEIRRLMMLQDAAADRRGVVDLTAALRDSERALRAMLPEGVGFNLQTGESPLWVEAAPGTLRHIATNLLAYGLSETANCAAVQVRCAREDQPDNMTSAGQGVLLEIGIDSHTNDTTLPRATRPSQGWEGGVCLAVVWKLAADLGGYADSYRAAPGNQLLRVYLPGALARGDGTASTGQMAHLWGTERVLLLSADPPDARQLARNLASLGYRAEIFADAESLRAALAPHGSDCLLLDASRRGIDIGRVHRALRAAAPGTPILIATPENTPLRDAGIVSDGWTCVVRKPFDLREIALTVRALARPTELREAARQT